jgi:hypothetical protein
MGCGGRQGIVRATGLQGGINSVSDHRTRRRAVLERTAKSCGSDASMVGVKSQRRRESPTGPELPVSVRRRGQESPIPRGERDISRKAIAQGMSDCLRCPVCSCALSFVHVAHETAGAARIRHSLLPPFGGTTKRKTSGRSRRENADAHHHVIARSPCDEAIHLANRRRCDMDCFAALAMTLIGRRTADTALRSFDNRLVWRDISRDPDRNVAGKFAAAGLANAP